mmetsp:Transcript_41129/g.68367  ORF Transcript_41129/g.68367 Transcript_41129/m.68367 type:complete len:145 (-) Transcript_41129:166-600(-)
MLYVTHLLVATAVGSWSPTICSVFSDDCEKGSSCCKLNDMTTLGLCCRDGGNCISRRNPFGGFDYVCRNLTSSLLTTEVPATRPLMATPDAWGECSETNHSLCANGTICCVASLMLPLGQCCPQKQCVMNVTIAGPISYCVSMA